MPSIIDVNVGRWPCFNRYVLQDGRIRPAQGAVLRTYSLPKLHETTEAERGDYHPTLTALEKLRGVFESVSPLATPEELVDTVLSFSKAFGLLGIFHHLLIYSQTALGSVGLDQHAAWIVTRTPTGFSYQVKSTAPGDPEPSSFATARKGVYHKHVGIVPAAALFDRFLPAYSNGRWPEYNDPEFWREYGEPLDEWVDAMRGLLRILKAFTHEGAHDFETKSAQSNVNQLLADVHPVVRFDKKNVRHFSHYQPTLLSALAMGVVRDSGIRQCAATLEGTRCPTIFSSSQPQSTYCTAKCANRDRVRRYRARQREAEKKKERRRARRRRQT